MKIKSLLLLTILALAFSGQSQVISIQAARNLGPGATVTVKGIVTNGAELGVIRYLQDSTAGIAAYGSTLSTVNRGDSIQITGVLKNYNQLLEIDPVSSFTVLSTGNPLPNPEVILPDSMVESRESELVRIDNATFTTNPGGVFSSNTSYYFTANGVSSSIYVRSGHPLIGSIVPSGAVSLIGLLSQFHYSSPTLGYQLLCRDSNDIINTSTISIISPVTNDSISTSGFTIDWVTNAAGTSEIFYGATAALGNHMAGSGTATNHHMKITGANPSQLFYIQAFSVLGSDTAFAPIRVFITQSVSTGDMKVYFNHLVDHSVSTGVNAVFLDNAIKDTLISYIDRATETIDFTMYNFTELSIATALNNAHSRGVTVRVIFDNAASNTGVQQLNSAIGKISNTVGSMYGIMHNKFIVIDANSSNPNLPIVWTGATNLTDGQLNTDPNNVIIIQDKSLALAFTLEFNEMFGSTSATPSLANCKFGPDKLDNTPHNFIIDGKKVDVYFSPSDGTNDVILGQINRANSSLDIATMLITRSDIGYALQDAVNNRGVDLKVLVNAEGDCSTIVWGILTNLIDSLLQEDATLLGIMHHKFMVVDHNTPEVSVLTGSHNWSNAANDKNDENTLVIYDQTIANQYYQAFYKRFMLNLTNGISTGSFNREVKIYPNPASDNLNIQIGAGSGNQATVSVFAIDGKKVFEKTTILNAASNILNINLSDYNSGLYILHIGTSDGNFVTKFVVE